MAGPVRWEKEIILVLFLCCSLFTQAQNVFRRFEYKYSFKPPYLAQKDGTVPFWKYSGNAIANEEMVRITPSLKSQKGSIWSSLKTNFEWWEVELVFRVTGRGRIGADGLAFWFTDKPSLEGPVFGSADRWNGLGIFFDSFDNDNKHNNPYIMAMVNDGSRVYDHQMDGSTQQLGGCLRDFRNKPFPVRAKIEYFKNTLTVLFHNGMSNNEQDYEMCFRVDNIFLPNSGFFGLSAATGGLADDHDALKFLTHSLHPQDVAPGTQGSQIPEADREKLAREFADYQQKLQQQKDDYHRENPNAIKQRDPEAYDEWFETDNQRELRQIFAGQSKMFETLRDLQRKMDEIVGRQERTMGMISTVQAGQGQVAQPAGGSAGQVPVSADTIRRHEVDAILANQRELVGAAREIRAFVTEIHQRSGTIMQNMGKQPAATAQVQSIGYDHVHSSLNEMKEGINIVKRDISITAQRLATAPAACPQTQGCLSTTVFIVFMAIELTLLIGYFVYRDNKEAQAKKFY